MTKCYLGRPWGAYAKTVFLDCTLGGHILPEGWHDWEKEGKPDTKKNSFYAEYGNTAPVPAVPRKVGLGLSAGKAGRLHLRKVMYQKQDGIVWDPYNKR